jgi:acyl dehydratase
VSGLEIDSKSVGLTMKEFRTTITQRQINNYAAAVYDPNPCYLDDRRADGLLAPPTLAAAITWPIIQNIYDYLDLDYPPEVLFQIVHYSEQLIIHRPLKAGDTIRIEGEIAAVIPEKNGTHVIFKLPASDGKDQPVFTEYIGGMLRGVKCLDQGRGINNIPPQPRTEPAAAPLWEVSLPIRREACYIYESCANVVFPIHTSPAFAESVGLPDILYYGIATLAQAVRELVNRENGADPANVKILGCYFRGMVLPDSFIRVQLLKREKSNHDLDLFFRVLNQNGKEAISDGYMKIAL